MCRENSKHWKEDDDRKFRASSVKERNTVRTSATCAVINSNSFRNPGKMDIGFVLCTVCGSDFSVAHGGEKDTKGHYKT